MDDTGGRALLRHLFEHHLWANAAIVDACADAPDEALDGESPGAYGSPRACLVHLLAAEERYVGLLGVAPPAPGLSEAADFPGFETLRARARWSGQALVDIAAELDPEAVWSGRRGDREWEIHLPLLLIQAINHATEHREQIKAGLTLAGAEPPIVDGWTYGATAGLIREV